VTFRQFIASLWHRKLTIAISVVVCVAAALAYSKTQTPTYQSTALVEMATATTVSGSTQPVVTLPDALSELGSTSVQLQAAKILGNPDVSAVANEVTGTVDPTSGALSITASASTPEEAQAVAKAYSQAYVDEIQAVVQAQVAKIQTALTSLTSTIAGLEQESGAATNPLIEAQVNAAESTYSTLKTQQYAIQNGEPYASIQVAAGLPAVPTGLGKSKLAAIGFLAGLLVGVGIALVREQLDTRLRTNPDIESITEAPILAELPQDGEVRSGKVSIALVQAPQSLMAESIRELRTSLRVIFDDSPCPMIVVTSPEPGDGKTFVAANLAASWAMSGSKVIVVSADFRRPRLEEMFGLQPTGLPGLADLIRSNWKNPDPDSRPNGLREDEDGTVRSPDRRTPSTGRASPSRGRRDSSAEPDQSSVKSMLVESGIWGLQVLPAGTQLDNPSELFGSPGIQPVLDQLPLLADVVLLDTPPVLAVPDTAVLGRLSQGAVIVASEGQTSRMDLERTVNRLESTRCRVLGVALNRVRRASNDSYQSYAYKQ
jgi:Mrp family chromosome partitioning ATPase/capsular polysaccharide biosynthesis protein